MKIKIIILFIISLHAFLLSKLIFFPYPELFVYPYLVKNGFLPYKQIFDQHLPSLLMSHFNFYDLGLRTPESARLFLIGSVTLTHFLLYFVHKKVSGKASILPIFIYLVVQPLFEGYILWLDTFLAPILLLGFYFSYKVIHERKDVDAILAGLFLGLAIFFKQMMIPLSVVSIVYIYLKTKSRKIAAIATLTALIPLFLSLAWILSKGIFNEFFYWTFIFNFEIYSRMAVKMPTLSQVVRVLLWYIPSIYVILKNLGKINFKLIAMFLLLPLADVIARFEFVHLQPTIPFVALLSAMFFSSKFKLKRVFSIAMIFVIAIWLFRFYETNINGKTYFFDSETIETSQKVSNLTVENDRIFILGTQPIVYPLSGRLPAGNLFTVNLPWNMKVAQRSILDGLKKDNPKIVVRDKEASIDGQKIVDFSSDINSFINSNYVKIDQIGNNEILKLKK